MIANSLNPATGRVYGPYFPPVAIADMVEAQRQVLNQLGIDRLAAVAGPSLGAMQALEWAVRRPDEVDRVIAAIGPTELQPREHEEDRAGYEVHGDALRGEATEDAADGGTDADLPDVSLRDACVEPLVDDRPEAGDEHRTERAEVEERRHRPHARPAREHEPLADQQKRAGRVEDRHEPRRSKPRREPADDEDEW